MCLIIWILTTNKEMCWLIRFDEHGHDNPFHGFTHFILYLFLFLLETNSCCFDENDLHLLRLDANLTEGSVVIYIMRTSDQVLVFEFGLKMFYDVLTCLIQNFGYALTFIFLSFFNDSIIKS